jgi:HPt (histidine-containing phosphotransfer) domain-containing protein
MSSSKKEKTSLEDVDVIDWDEAMQQCGDDEEFLLELLADLRDETDTQMSRMEEIVEKKEPTDSTFIGIVRAAHVIKGAASNLMCEQLRVTAMNLETNAQIAANAKDAKEKPQLLDNVVEKLDLLKIAVANYHKYITEEVTV